MHLHGGWGAARLSAQSIYILSNNCTDHDPADGLATGSVDNKESSTQRNKTVILIDIWESRYSKILTGDIQGGGYVGVPSKILSIFGLCLQIFIIKCWKNSIILRAQVTETENATNRVKECSYTL